MANQINVTVNGSAVAKTFKQTYSEEADNAYLADKTGNSAVPGAKSGTLTTRTDENTGTLTMSSGHGITTGAKIDLFWAGGSRYNVTVGTVSTNSVPIDLGSGDDLPVATTEITACVHVTEDFTVDGDNVVAVMADSDYKGYVKFLDNSDAVLLALYMSDDADNTYVWVTGMSTNPLASAAVAKVAFSNAATTAKNMRAAVLYN